MFSTVKEVNLPESFPLLKLASFQVTSQIFCFYKDIIASVTSLATFVTYFSLDRFCILPQNLIMVIVILSAMEVRKTLGL